LLNEFVAAKIALNELVHHIVQNDASFRVHYWGVMPEHHDNLPHKHSFFEVCYILEGQGFYIDDDCTYPIQKNTMFLSRPDVLHHIESETGLFIIYVGFELIESESNEEWISIMKEAKNCSKVVKDIKDDTVAPLIWKSLLLQASNNKYTLSQELLTCLAYSLIHSLLQTFVPYLNHSNDNPVHKKSSGVLAQAKLYIEDNLSSPLKITDIASHLHISSRHLSRLFGTELGVSYSEYVQNERVQRAAILLKKTDLSIKDIVEETGFSNVHYFTRVFTSTMRSSPGRFRSLYTKLKTTKYIE
jgi:AraC family transcriptional regulator, arabinose operon regulatory protein